MFQGRRLCKISLIVFLVVALSAFGSWDFLGVNAKAELAKQFLLDGVQVQATGQIYHKEIKNDSVVYYVKNATISFDGGRLYKTSFLFKYNSDKIPNYSKVNITGSVSKFDVARNPGSFSESSYYNSLGLCFDLTDVKLINASGNLLVWQDFMYRINDNILQVFKSCLPGEEAGFLASITLGNKSNLLGELKDLFQYVGLAHVLAVSGLHVSVICMALYRLLRKRGVRYLGSGIGAGIVAIGYGFLTGGSISSIRAIGMFLVFLLAEVLGRPYDSLTALAFMADILIISHPCYIKNGSFIFSFGAILGINFIVLPITRQFDFMKRTRQKLLKSNEGFGKKIKKPIWLRLLEWLASSFIFSFGMYVAMLPMVTQMYYETPILSTFLNIFVLPLMPFLLILGLMGGVLGLVFLPLGRIILFPCHLIIYLYELLSAGFEKFPMGRVIVGHRSIVLCLFYYLMIVLIVYWDQIKSSLKRLGININLCNIGSVGKKNFYGENDGSNSHVNNYCNQEFEFDMTKLAGNIYELNPYRKMAMARKFIVVRLVLFLGVAVIWLLPHGQQFEIDILDVGQGDSIYISSGDGVSFFIDGGSTTSLEVGKYTILPFLKYKGITHIDYWFLSHMDMDHVAGIIHLLQEGYRIDNIVLSAQIPSGDTLSRILELASNNGTNVIYMNPGDLIGTKHIGFTCLFPYSGYSCDDINGLSLSLLMEYDRDCDGARDYSAFFGGDLGAEQEKAIASLYGNADLEKRPDGIASVKLSHVDLLKVSHHGSKYSSDAFFLDILSPRLAVISCAKRNMYGHPSAEAVDRLQSSGATIYYTMEGGCVRITLGGINEYVVQHG